MTSDSTQTIYRSASRFLSGTLISRFTGMLRDIAMAFAFGTESTLAAFMVAYRFAHLARRLFGEGSLQNTFIPQFEELRIHSKERALAFFRDLSLSIFMILACFIVGIMTILYVFYSLSSSDETKEMIIYAALMLPSLFFLSLYGLNSALLNCEKYFFISGSAPAAFNVIWIFASFLLASMPIKTAMVGLSFAIVIGCMAQMAVTIPQTLKILPSNRFIFHARPFSKDVRRLLKPLILANFGVAASQVNNALDPLFALFANAEGPAWLWYAIRIQQLPLALFGIAIANALIPPFSRAIKSNNLEKFRELYDFSYKQVLVFTILITAGILATAPSCINLLFGRGHFNNESISGTSNCLIAYGIGLFPMAYVLITAPALFAFEDYKTPVKGAYFAMCINLVLNTLFVFFLEWNSESVAFATSIASFWNAYFLSKFISQKAGPLNHSAKELIKVLSVSFFALSSVWLSEHYVFGNAFSLQVMLHQPIELSHNFFFQLYHFTFNAIIFCIIPIFAYRKSLFKKFDF